MATKYLAYTVNGLAADVTGNITLSGGGGSYTASNGLTLTGSNLTLGGSLTVNTTIDLTNGNLTLSSTTGNTDFYLSTISAADVWFFTTTTRKWGIGMNATSDFQIGRYNTSLLGLPLIINNTTGKWTIGGYGSGTFSGSPTYVLGVNSSGDLIETTLSGGSSYTASNGLTLVGSDIQLGSTSGSGSPLTRNSYINTSTFTLYMTKNSAGNIFEVSNTNGNGIVSTTNGVSIAGTSTNTPGSFVNTETTNTTTRTVLSLTRTGFAGATGTGEDIVFGNPNSLSTNFTSGYIKHILTNATSASEASSFELHLLNAGIGTIGRRLLLNGTGKLRLDKYGVGTFTGTAAFSLAVDSSGNVIETAVGGGSTYTASGGLTLTGSNFALGGTLSTTVTTISGGNSATSNLILNTGSYSGSDGILTISSSGIIGLKVVGGTGNYGIFVLPGAGGIGVCSSGSDGIGFSGKVTTGQALYAQVTGSGLGLFITKAENTNGAVTSVMESHRSLVSGTPTAGIGQSIDLYLTTTSGDLLATSIISKITSMGFGTINSEFSITGLNNSVSNVILQISGSGVFTLTQGLTNYANDAAAASGGIPVNGLYRNGSIVQIRVT